MNDPHERQRAVARWTSGPAPLMRSNVWAAMLILFDPSEATWARYHSEVYHKNMFPNAIKLDSVTADIVMRAMAIMATATEPSVFAHHTRVVSDAMQRVFETPGLSPHMRVYLSFRDDHETYFGRHLLPLDIFIMIEKHIDPPYAARAPVGKLKQGDAFYVAAMEPYERRHAPMATMNIRGELVVSLQKGDVEAQIAQVHGAYQRRFPAPFVPRGKWPNTEQHYAIAFSATHFAVCTLRSKDDQTKWSIAIRPAENILADPHVCIEHVTNSTPMLVAQSPIVSNGDGTLYITELGLSDAPSTIYQYRLDSSSDVGYTNTLFVCAIPYQRTHCATGDFICVKSEHGPRSGFTVYELPKEPHMDGALADIAPYIRCFVPYVAKGTPTVGPLPKTSACLDSVGNLFGIDIYPGWFDLWTCTIADGCFHNLGTFNINSKICRPVELQYTPQIVLHPSGRIFVLYQELYGAGRHSVQAQELVKDADEYKVCFLS